MRAFVLLNGSYNWPANAEKNHDENAVSEAGPRTQSSICSAGSRNPEIVNTVEIKNRLQLRVRGMPLFRTSMLRYQPYPVLSDVYKSAQRPRIYAATIER